MEGPAFKAPFAIKKRPNKATIDVDPALERLVNDVEGAQILDIDHFDLFMDRLETAVVENAEGRGKHSETPELFYQSEVALYELVVQLGAAAVDLRILERLSGEGSLALILPIINHPNDDISGSLIKNLLEITDLDVGPGEDAHYTWKFVVQCSKNGVFGILLEKVIETAEGPLIDDLLRLFGNLLFWADRDAGGSQAVVEGWPIWLVDTLTSPAEQKDISMRAGELLSDLVTTVPEAINTFANEDQLVALLLEFYQRLSEGGEKEGTTEHIKDGLSAVVDVFCALLLSSNCRGQFIESSGLRICLESVRKPGAHRMFAIRLLSFAIADEVSVRSLINAGGLSFIFPLLVLGIPPSHTAGPPSKDLWELYNVERLLSIVAVMFRELPKGDDQHYERLLRKLEEGEGQKSRQLARIFTQLEAHLLSYGDNVEVTKVIQSSLDLSALILAHLTEEGERVSLTIDEPLKKALKIRLSNYLESCEESEYRTRISTIMETTLS